MRRRALISLTPLIDVVFILLVFFMLASSFMDWRMLELGVAKAGGASGMTGAVLVELRPESMRISGRVVSEEELMQTLASRLGKDPSQRVLIKPGEGVELQRAIDLIDQIGAIGGRDVSFVAAQGGQ